MASWDYIKGKINGAYSTVKKIAETVKENPVLDQAAKLAIAQIPVAGPFILEWYNSVGGKEADKVTDVLKFLENLQQKDDEYFTKLSEHIEKNHDEIIKNREILSELISKNFEQVLRGQKEIRADIKQVDEKLDVLLSSLGDGFKIVDKISPQITSFVKNEPEDIHPYSVIAEKKGNQINFTRQDNHMDIQTITADDLRNLDENSQRLIQAREESMQRQFELWTIIYPKRNDSADPVVNARVEQQLKDITKTMCNDLTKILYYLQSIGKYLHDHYDHIYNICNEFKNSNP